MAVIEDNFSILILAGFGDATRMNALVFWEEEGLTLQGSNPYAGLLAQGMEPLGVQCTAGFAENLTADWMTRNAGRFDVLHLHWPSFLYRCDSLEKSVQRCRVVIDALLVARSLGCKVVWTMHNLYPHDSDVRELDHLARLAITSLASAVIVHCERARSLLKSHFHRSEGVFTIPHGHFRDPYPNDVAVENARSRFGFSEENFVYLFIGTVRANKGVEQLLESFRKLPDPNARLLFAARVCNDYGAKLVDGAQQLDARIVNYKTTLFANDEFQHFYNAADCAVFPFSDILTSGSAITALSFFCPVVIPRLGCLPELVDPSVGVLYDSQSTGGLGMALQTAASDVCRSAMRPAIELLLNRLSWDDIGRKTVDAYRQ